MSFLTIKSVFTYATTARTKTSDVATTASVGKTSNTRPCRKATGIENSAIVATNCNVTAAIIFRVTLSSTPSFSIVHQRTRLYRPIPHSITVFALYVAIVYPH